MGDIFVPTWDQVMQHRVITTPSPLFFNFWPIVRQASLCGSVVTFFIRFGKRRPCAADKWPEETEPLVQDGTSGACKRASGLWRQNCLLFFGFYSCSVLFIALRPCCGRSQGTHLNKHARGKGSFVWEGKANNVMEKNNNIWRNHTWQCD